MILKIPGKMSNGALGLLLIFSFAITSSHGASLICYNGTMDSFTRVPISGLPLLLAYPCLDTGRPTVIYTFGYRGRVAGPATTAVIAAYLATKKRNVILLDWESEAATGLLGVQLSYALNAVPNAIRIGGELGDALVAISVAGIPLGRLHLMGHSLGAQLMGHAGRRARSRGFIVPRITGLDPASALYEAPMKMHSGLDRSCALFVDIIHTDPGKYGVRGAYGTIDIWPNYKTDDSTVQPGCVAGDFEDFSTADLCNHDRSWQLYADSLASPTSLLMMNANNYEDWLLRSLNRVAVNTSLLGELTDTKSRGNFYLSTNAAAPYGRGEAGLWPNTQATTRRRRTSRRLILRRIRRRY